MQEKSLSELIVEGLLTDGAHHKQWFLEEILKKLIAEEGLIQLKNHIEWEEGIAP